MPLENPVRGILGVEHRGPDSLFLNYFFYYHYFICFLLGGGVRGL